MAYKARNNIRELKHTGSISKYVDDFSKLMLQIDNMSTNDLLFNFMEGLQRGHNMSYNGTKWMISP